MSYGFGMMIESLVAILLMLTISYCMMLNARLKRLKADEKSLKATISELVAATELAERAVAGLKATAVDCEDTLGERLCDAEHVCTSLHRQVRASEIMVDRLSRLVVAAGPLAERAPTKAPDPRAVAAAVNAFAERARERSTARAA